MKKITTDPISFNELEKIMTDPENIRELMPQIEEHIDQLLKVKLPKQMPMISMFISDKTIAPIKATFLKELEEIFPTLISNYLVSLKNN